VRATGGADTAVQDGDVIPESLDPGHSRLPPAIARLAQPRAPGLAAPGNANSA
jgi:hypothetical protein